jgi:SAM domain (Sterile alpha motif)
MPSIEHWLNGLGWAKYSKVLVENDVDLSALPHLNGADLQELRVHTLTTRLSLKKPLASNGASTHD